MKTHLLPATAALTACLALAPVVASTRAQDSTPAPQQYTLISGSFLLEDCPICDRVSRPVPMYGTCVLIPMVSPGPLQRYEVRDIQFTAGDPAARAYTVSGEGVYEIFSEFATVHRLTLTLDINNGAETKRCYFTNAPALPPRVWPMMGITVAQANGTAVQDYHLELDAAPFRDLWFPVQKGFHSGNRTAGSAAISGGDVISLSGATIRTAHELAASVGLKPPTTDPGIDVVTLLPGGNLGFSFATDTESTSLGALQQGDLLSSGGLLVSRNQALTTKFGIMPVVPDLGLDAAQWRSSGETLFSIQKDAVSELLGTKLGHGDILSSKGTVLRKNKELMALFHPVKPLTDQGLHAFYVWPGGEVWFSPATGFEDQALGTVQAGDLLSDQGYVVYRNRDLLRLFSPLEDLADFGLDGLAVITDVEESTAAGPHLDRVAREPGSGEVRLEWTGKGRVFQVERSGEAEGPYLPVGPLQLEQGFVDPPAGTQPSRGFYRVRQW